MIGLVLALATLLTTLSAQHDDEPVVFAPTSAAEVRDSYDLGAGELLVDLSRVEDVEGLEGRVVTIDAALGELEVVVPEGMDVSVEATTGIGGVELFGDETGGVGGMREALLDGGEDVPDMRILIDLGVGQVTVREAGEQR
ncbi:LiaF domain-containing protein [Nocardioides piscis]|uniref:Cell wall-active antibiotics response protein n=1 Tax=Nocardioides piscis TaxID=2714938 RepID=A0A6G7YFB3_9ACTN|nr:LiaF domain-containing protein [Nocardioides piscis]QIK75495.1 cell wall-active antibiotics response protein [Nocardioides piscis]